MGGTLSPFAPPSPVESGEIWKTGELVAREKMVIFTRTFDFLSWLLRATSDFPRAHRHTFVCRMLDAAFDSRERLEEANHRQGRARSDRLERADEGWSEWLRRS